MLDLLRLLLERMGIIVTVAFLITRSGLFRQIINIKATSLRIKTIMVIIFGAFGILGTYTGIPIVPHQWEYKLGFGIASYDEALANSRVVGVFIAGLLGGPIIGFGAGVIAGVHRFWLGGFTALACGIATVIEGLIGGYLGKKHGYVNISGWRVFIAGGLAEVIQMLIILLLARPFESAWALVKIISLPMIVSNGMGIAIFILILQSVIRDKETIGALQAQKALEIANSTLPYFRKGLNPCTARQAAEIIRNSTGLAAVAFTDRERILAHVGVGSDHHKSDEKVFTLTTKKVLMTGEMQVAVSSEDIACLYEKCPLSSAVVAPLKIKEQVVGSLKLYLWPKNRITSVEKKLAEGIAHLFSGQLELAEAEKRAHLLSKAEIKALQAQINPHFLFNSLNTIVALIRTKPELARKLLVNLGDFFRQNLQSSEQEMITLEQEVKHVRSYLAIEEARFGDRIKISISIPEGIFMAKLPPLTLQPLVENAIRHGLKNKKAGGEVEIVGHQEGSKVRIQIIDNGIGMEVNKISQITEAQQISSEEGCGIALSNVYQRLIAHYGNEASFTITSQANEGTTVTLEFPILKGCSNEV